MEYRLWSCVSLSFLQNNNHQAVKKMEWIENRKIRKNTDKNCWDFVYVWLQVCECMWVCAHACMCYNYIWMRVFMRLSQAMNAALSILYSTWFDTYPQSDLVTTNTLIIYMYVCMYVCMYLFGWVIDNFCFSKI